MISEILLADSIRKILSDNAKIEVLKFSYHKAKGNPFGLDLTVDYDLAIEKIIDLLKESGVGVKLSDDGPEKT